MTSDSIDIGDVERVGNEFIVVRQGVGNPTLYYIPKSFIDNYDGSCLYVAVPSGLAAANSRRYGTHTRRVGKIRKRTAWQTYSWNGVISYS